VSKVAELDASFEGREASGSGGNEESEEVIFYSELFGPDSARIGLVKHTFDNT
jgi:hypothetical protein